MNGKSTLLTLNNGIQMPALGLGVYGSSTGDTAGAVATAIGAGYRLIDTAAVYMNEQQVGEGVRNSGIDRREIFVTTKVWMSDYGYDRTLHAFERSRGKLGLDYVDLYLLHWPVPTDFDSTIESYRAAEKLLAEGKARAIGVSNFSPRHLENLLARTTVVPAVNQIELHPFFIQKELREANAKLGIITQAWSPIGGVKRNSPKESGMVEDPLAHPIIVEMAGRHGRTPAQIILRWHIQHGSSAIPKSVRPERIYGNINLFDFKLTNEEVAAIDSLDTGGRAGPDPESFTAQIAGVKIED